MGHIMWFDNVKMCDFFVLWSHKITRLLKNKKNNCIFCRSNSMFVCNAVTSRNLFKYLAYYLFIFHMVWVDTRYPKQKNNKERAKKKKKKILTSCTAGIWTPVIWCKEEHVTCLKTATWYSNSSSSTWEKLALQFSTYRMFRSKL